MVKTEQDIIELAYKYARELEKLGVPVEEILLFGSYARGEARTFSDIDLAIVSTRFGKGDGLEFSGILSQARLSINEIIEAIGLSPEQIDKAPKYSLIEDIKKTGKVVYKKAA